MSGDCLRECAIDVLTCLSGVVCHAGVAATEAVVHRSGAHMDGFLYQLARAGNHKMVSGLFSCQSVK